MFPLLQAGEPSLFKAHDHSAKESSTWVQGRGSVWQVHIFPLLWWVEVSYLCGTAFPPLSHSPHLISLPSAPKAMSMWAPGFQPDNLGAVQLSLSPTGEVWG